MLQKYEVIVKNLLCDLLELDITMCYNLSDYDYSYHRKAGMD